MCCPWWTARPASVQLDPRMKAAGPAPAYEGPGQHTDPVTRPHQRLLHPPLHPPGPGSPPKAPVTAHVPAGSSRKENQDPGGLEGFISIQLHSRASRFLISHLTFKDWLAGPGPLTAACLAEPRRAARRSRSGAAAGPCQPVPAAPRGGQPHTPPAGPTGGCPQPTEAALVGRGPERP